MSRSQLASHGRVLRGQYRSEGIVTYNKDAVNNKPWSEGSIICRISACGLRLRLNPTPSRVSSCRKDRLICVCALVCVRSCAFINEVFQVLTKRNKHYLLKRRRKKHLRNISTLTQSKYKEEDIISLVWCKPYRLFETGPTARRKPQRQSDSKKYPWATSLKSTSASVLRKRERSISHIS